MSVIEFNQVIEKTYETMSTVQLIYVKAIVNTILDERKGKGNTREQRSKEAIEEIKELERGKNETTNREKISS